MRGLRSVISQPRQGNRGGGQVEGVDLGDESESGKGELFVVAVT